MIRGLLLIPALAVSLIAAASGQIATSLKLGKKQHLAGEPVIATVTITNHAGRELLFSSDGRFQWLDFIVKTSNGNTVSSRGKTVFGPMKIGAGESLSRKVDLSKHFQLDSPGNYSVAAVIHFPGDRSKGSSTNRVFFNQSPGREYWSQEVGISGSKTKTRKFRLLNFSGDQRSHLYAQVVDGRTGTFLSTFRLGDVLMLRKPLATVDLQQRMHVLFLATPTMWVHCIINTDGRLVDRTIHQRAAKGDPRLLTFGDGTVRVTNSIPYDPEAASKERSKIRKTSDRPNVGF